MSFDFVTLFSSLSGNHSFSSHPYKDAKEIKISFVTGGATGGSCWDDEPAEPYSNEYCYEEQEDFKKDLKEKLLKQIDCTLEQAEDAVDLAKESYDSDWEYYGNYTDYVIFLYSLEDLQNWFTKHNLKEKE